MQIMKADSEEEMPTTSGSCNVTANHVVPDGLDFEYEAFFFTFSPKSFVDSVYNVFLECTGDYFNGMRSFLVSELTGIIDADLIDERIRKLRKEAFGAFLVDFHCLEAYIQDSIFHIPNYVLLPEHEKFRGDSQVSTVDEKCMAEKLEHLLGANKKTLFMNEMLRKELNEIEILDKFYDSILEKIDLLEERLESENLNISSQNAILGEIGRYLKLSEIEKCDDS